MASFKGFSEETIQFLLELRANNNRDWFKTNKSRYEQFVKEPSKEFSIALAGALSELSPHPDKPAPFEYSIFRIYRDIRFSKDKSPYKTNIGALFWQGDKPKMENPGFYFHLEPPNLMLGNGLYKFSKEVLNEYRDSVVDPKTGRELLLAIQKVQEKGPYSIGGQHYKRTPRGYDPDVESADLLLHNGLYTGLESEIPVELYSSSLIDYCLGIYRDLTPIYNWLVELVERT
jgi:uncharacterized protein (TIGR02453 family)